MKKHLLVAQGLRRQFSQRPIGTLSCNHFYPALPLAFPPVPPQVCASSLFRIVLNYGVEMSLLPTAALIRWFGDLELLLDAWSTGMVLVSPMGVLLPVLRQWGPLHHPDAR
jgi:hypothetical protein